MTMLDVHYIYDHNKKPVNEYTLKNGKYQVSAINLGAAITKLIVPNKFDKLENIILRYYDYKLYKKNKYLLGSIIDYDKFIKKEECTVNHYFNCDMEESSLIFTFQEEEKLIKVKYTLNENYLLIEYSNNLNLRLCHVLFFNLSGNLKDNISEHDIIISDEHIDYKQDITFFNELSTKTKAETVSINYQNGINMKIFSSGESLHLSFGKYFNNEFYLNKQTIAEEYIGIGLAILSPSICFEF